MCVLDRMGKDLELQSVFFVVWIPSGGDPPSPNETIDLHLIEEQCAELLALFKSLTLLLPMAYTM